VPTCFECGYDLTGLDLPHRCPECGRVADPQNAGDEVYAWFASRRAVWLRSPPACFMAQLHEGRCLRVAARRLLISLVVPWLVLVGLVVGLNCLAFSNVYERSPSSANTAASAGTDRFGREGRAFSRESKPLADNPAWNVRRVGTTVRLARLHVDEGTRDTVLFLMGIAGCGLIATWVCTRVEIITENGRGGVGLHGYAALAACGLLAGPIRVLMACGAIWALLEALGGWGLVVGAWPVWAGDAALAGGVLAFAVAGAMIQCRIGQHCRLRWPPMNLTALIGALSWLMLTFMLVFCPLATLLLPIVSRD
jgi:hypothetical protein